MISSCQEEEAKENKAPGTKFVLDEINLYGENRLNTVVKLSWFGSDPDGYVDYYELSYDKINWTKTNKRDSTFHFSIQPQSDTTDIDLYVRSVDNEKLADPNPAYLSIPIKNTAPEAAFNDKLNFPDTTFLVATTAWSAKDIDGDETITKVMISLNGKDWVAINKQKNIISIVPDNPTATDTTNALVYFDSEATPANLVLKGLSMNDTNRLYLKAIDQAESSSAIDTSTSFYMKGKKNNVLVVGGVPNFNSDYKSLMNAANIDYDFIDFGSNAGAMQPYLWDVTFKLQLSFYDKLFLYSDETLFINPYNNLKALILDFAAVALQGFVNKGGKYLISTSFDHNTDLSAFTSLLPIAGVSDKNFGDARLYQDSIAYSSLNAFPDLKPTNFAITGVSVFNIDSADTEVIYEASLSDIQPNNPWPDVRIIASGRRNNGKLNQVFFSVQLQALNGNGTHLTDLFDRIFNVEFN